MIAARTQYIIHYFSGTGNTARAAQLIQKQLLSAEHQAELRNIEHDHGPVPSDATHVFMYPVYALYVPHIMRRYIGRLPMITGASAAIIAIYGEVDQKHSVPGHPGSSLERTEHLLWRKGFKVFLAGKAGYPFNASLIANTPLPEENLKICADGDAQIRTLAKDILGNKRAITRSGLMLRFGSALFGCAFDVLGRRWMGKLYVADENCTRCGQCVEHCPAKAISMVRERPRWNYQCEACMRCINSCPQAAIQTSLWRLALSIFSPGIWFIVLPFYIVLVNEVLMWLIYVFIMDHVLFFLETLPRVRKLFQLNITCFFRRYKAPAL